MLQSDEVLVVPGGPAGRFGDYRTTTFRQYYHTTTFTVRTTVLLPTFSNLPSQYYRTTITVLPYGTTIFTVIPYYYYLYSNTVLLSSQYYSASLDADLVID